MPNRQEIRVERNIEERTDQKVLPTPNTLHEADGDVDVNNIDLVIPIVDCTITDFTNGKEGQTIRVLGTGTTSTISGARIVRQSADPLVANRIYLFTYVEFLTPGGTLVDKWIENI